jgi:hypothetical protein
MFEYVACFYFVVLLVFIVQKRNKCPSFELKTFELSLILYITYKNPLLGIICAMIFLKQCTIEGMISHVKKPSRIHVDEQMRPKRSNISDRQTGLPPQDSLTGQMAKPYSQLPSKYTPF